MPSASGSHNFLAAKLSRLLGAWLDEHELGVVFHDTEFVIGESRLRPDLAVLYLPQWERLESDAAPVLEVPIIAVEIVSPSESAIQPDEKIAEYLAAGVQEAWALYPSTGHLFINRTDSTLRLDRNNRIETPLIPGWSLEMSLLLRKKGRRYF
jgi:Uma2 family endonuclease